ncbi:MAG: GNAT family N-acetyltransferase [Enterococcus lemanii]|mgnify:CR=1 FL=1|jgi:ribosomal protein S18 acetylase RimI-like enzyme
MEIKWRTQIQLEDWPLLLKADPEKKVVESYLGTSELLEIRDKNQLLGLLVLQEKNTTTVEIMNVSVVKEAQNQGIGQQLLREALRKSREQAYEQIEVKTGTTSLVPLIFYQKQGFRVVSVLADYFTQNYQTPLVENGVTLKDALLLQRSLID